LFAQNDYPLSLKVLVVTDVVWMVEAITVYVFLHLSGVSTLTLYYLQTFNLIVVITLTIAALVWHARVSDNKKRRDSEKAERETQSDLISLLDRIENKNSR
jgi:hypothetical protein